MMEDTRKISEMRNLGPACEADLAAAGITTAQQVIDLGVEETFYRAIIGRKARGAKPLGFHAAFLYAIYGAIHDIDWRDVPPDQKSAFKKLTAKLRG